MTRARSATAIIWSTVVSAGAMLGTPACGGGNSAKPVKPTPVTHSDPTPTPPAEPIYVGAPDPIETLDPPVVEAPQPVPVVAMVKLTITSTPVGATVYGGDGEVRGTTPLILEMPSSAEPLTLRVTHDGYGDKEMVVKPQSDATFDFTLVKKRVRGSGGGGGKGTGRGFVLS